MSAIRVRSVRESGRLLRLLASVALLSTLTGIGLFSYSEAYFKLLKTWKLKKALGIPIYRSHVGRLKMDYAPGSAADRILGCGGQGNSTGLVIHMVHTATSSHRAGEFPARYSCAVEAAAATGANVVVHSSSLGTEGQIEDALWPSLHEQGSEADRRAAFSSVKNVSIKKLDIGRLFGSLPLQEWYKVEIIQVSDFLAS